MCGGGGGILGKVLGGLGTALFGNPQKDAAAAAEAARKEAEAKAKQEQADAQAKAAATANAQTALQRKALRENSLLSNSDTTSAKNQTLGV